MTTTKQLGCEMCEMYQADGIQVGFLINANQIIPCFKCNPTPEKHLKASCDRCESRGLFRVPSVVSLDGAYFCRPCAEFYKEEIQRKAADVCKNTDHHWHKVDGCCSSCHQAWNPATGVRNA